MDLIICTGGTLIENPGVGTYLIIAIVLTAGTAFLLWLGEANYMQKVLEMVFQLLSLLVSLQVFQQLLNQIYAQQFQNAGDQLFITISS